MKVKCKICGQKGFHEFKLEEYWASRFLFISKFGKKKYYPYYICRKCISDILDGLQNEQYRIDELYKPEIKEKQK